jgi:hypothetical protein
MVTRALRVAGFCLVVVMSPRLCGAGEAVEPGSALKAWGTSAGASTVSGHELTAEDDWTDNAFDPEMLHRSATGTFCDAAVDSTRNHAATAQFLVPDGASLDQFRAWSYDDHADLFLTYELYESCQGVGFDPPAATLLTSLETFGDIGYVFGFKPLGGRLVNNRDCIYTVRVIFAPQDISCASDTLQVQKMQILWTRQVSPAPAAASFGDVPPSHPFFQFVEALAKSGITGGCGSGNFCPDAALTRGQMAVFLAKALGLQWP